LTPKTRQKCGIPAVSRNFGSETGRTERMAATGSGGNSPQMEEVKWPEDGWSATQV
jgi:hypothetical protein